MLSVIRAKPLASISHQLTATDVRILRHLPSVGSFSPNLAPTSRNATPCSPTYTPLLYSLPTPRHFSTGPTRGSENRGDESNNSEPQSTPNQTLTSSERVDDSQLQSANDSIDNAGEGEKAVETGILGLPKTLVRDVGILTGSQFIITAGFGIIIPVLPMLSNMFGLGATGIGALVAAPSAVRVLLNMPMGQLADRIGRKPLMVAGTIASAVGGIGTGLASTLMTLLPMRALVGAGSASSMAGSSAYMADLTAKVRTDTCM